MAERALPGRKWIERLASRVPMRVRSLLFVVILVGFGYLAGRALTGATLVPGGASGRSAPQGRVEDRNDPAPAVIPVAAPATLPAAI